MAAISWMRNTRVTPLQFLVLWMLLVLVLHDVTQKLFLAFQGLFLVVHIFHLVLASPIW
jgi:hypothetical protein